MSEFLNPCPCCGNLTIEDLGTYELCSVCGWEDDPIQSINPKYFGGANKDSLEEHKKLYLRSKASRFNTRYDE
ncbi:CPCC family cysteine-rich protein [Methylobacterium indicum]|uniref:CPCC family cysteine-rich protein n=1 Tax=Methylobacterium indicum TaxID=1775910 RepID=UPI0009E435E2